MLLGEKVLCPQITLLWHSDSVNSEYCKDVVVLERAHRGRHSVRVSSDACGLST